MAQQLSTKKAWRVLIVDDNKDTAELVSLQMAFRGCELRVATDGPAAIEIARDFCPDLVLLDLLPPEMSGYDVARALRAEGSKSRIVGITAMTEPRRFRKNVDIDEYIVKPLFMAIIDALCEELDARQVRNLSP